MFAFDLPFVRFVYSKCLPAEQTIRVATWGWIVYWLQPTGCLAIRQVYLKKHLKHIDRLAVYDLKK